MPPVKQKGNSHQDQIFLIGLSVFGASIQSKLSVVFGTQHNSREDQSLIHQFSRENTNFVWSFELWKEKSDDPPDWLGAGVNPNQPIKKEKARAWVVFQNLWAQDSSTRYRWISVSCLIVFSILLFFLNPSLFWQ